jgi:uncharacterized integral membrane protein
VRKREGERDWQPRLWLSLIALALVVAYLIAFVVENSRSVKICWVFATTHSSVIWVIVVSLLIGLASGVLLSQLHRHRWRRRHAHSVEDTGQTADPVGDLGRRDEAERKPG